MSTSLSHQAPSLTLHAPDDDMEISSDYGRGDQDIDIDLDAGDDYRAYDDDDHMIEDARSDAASVTHQHYEQRNTDDIMLDGDGEQAEDGIMEDETTLQDEDLLDASDYMLDSAEQTLVAPEQVPSESLVPDQPSYLEATHVNIHTDLPEITGANDITVLEGQNNIHEQFTGNIGHDNETDADLQSKDLKQDTYHERHGLDQISDYATQQDSQQQDRQQETQADNLPLSEVDVHSEAGLEQMPSTVTQESITSVELNESRVEDIEKTQEVSQRNGGPHGASATAEAGDVHEAAAYSPTEYGTIHPAIIIWRGEEISLFPPHGDNTCEQFFLSDESLANSSIKDMLHDCRNVLGNSITGEEELQLYIADLGLTISEDSIHAPTTSLSEIIDLYVQLHEHDGTENAPPIYIKMSKHSKFSSRLQQLVALVSQGVGLSQLHELLPSFDDGEDDEDVEAYDGGEEEVDSRSPLAIANSTVSGEQHPGIHTEAAGITQTSRGREAAEGSAASPQEDTIQPTEGSKPVVENTQVADDTEHTAESFTDYRAESGDGEEAYALDDDSAHDETGESGEQPGTDEAVLEEVVDANNVPVDGVSNARSPVDGEAGANSSGSSTVQGDEAVASYEAPEGIASAVVPDGEPKSAEVAPATGDVYSEESLEPTQERLDDSRAAEADENDLNLEAEEGVDHQHYDIAEEQPQEDDLHQENDGGDDAEHWEIDDLPEDEEFDEIDYPHDNEGGGFQEYGAEQEGGKSTDDTALLDHAVDDFTAHEDNNGKGDISGDQQPEALSTYDQSGLENITDFAKSQDHNEDDLEDPDLIDYDDHNYEVAAQAEPADALPSMQVEHQGSPSSGKRQRDEELDGPDLDDDDFQEVKRPRAE